MTPKEKAEDLAKKLFEFNQRVKWDSDNDEWAHDYKLAKQCALIAVDEIINSRNDDRGFDDTLSSVSSEYYTAHPMYLTYWQEVKQEIIKL